MAEQLYFHALVGRLRVAVPAVKRSRTVAREVEALLRFLGVSHVSANPQTGNVLVLYDQDRTTQEQILAALKDEDFLPRTARHMRSGGGQVPMIGEAIAQRLLQTALEAALHRLLRAFV